jgi:hypothetical protein
MLARSDSVDCPLAHTRTGKTGAAIVGWLRGIGRKFQRDIPCYCVGVPGIHVNHATDDRRSGSIQRAPMRSSNSRGELFGCIEIPDYFSIAGVVSSQMTIKRSGENYSRD